ncbi:Co2+/Mg2+ efflux protein ApaG [Polaribacter sp.]|uniref:Co2+/Mg2+ efflux protein ApaG n=1 Tax=Polaribacter sp. TaxID=1920175 RepID=UPI0025CF0B3F|nr:Co2+/Mg2+ efflux protein ApaG [Polaribacter sp.]
MVQQVTKGIKISVKTKFNGVSYRDTKLYYVFAYHITIENNSSETVELTSRFWKIYDSLNKIEIVAGKGVVGQTPVLQPKEHYAYSSGCFLISTIGAMTGYFTMQNTNTLEEFKVLIPTFQLITPLSSN